MRCGAFGLCARCRRILGCSADYPPPLILHFYIVVSEYGKDGADAEIVLLKRKGKIDVRSISVADFIRENILKQKSYKQLVFFSISDNKQGLTLRARCQPLFYWFVVFLFGEEVYALQPRFLPTCLAPLRSNGLRSLDDVQHFNSSSIFRL